MLATSNEWTLPNSGDVALKNLKKSFIDNFAFVCVESTLKTYGSPLKQFKIWCQRKSLRYLPIEPLIVSIYLTKLTMSTKSHAPILLASLIIFFSFYK